MTPKKNKLRLSASKIKSMEQCSFKFFCNYILKLPETTHPKTFAGTVAHNIYEALMHPKRKEFQDKVLESGSVREFPSLMRYCNAMIRKFEIIEEVAIPIPDMIDVGLMYLKGLLDDPEIIKVIPEYEFTLHTDEYEIKGFIDLLVIYKDKALIVDYKSQGRKFTGEQMNYNIQGLVYQLAVRQIFDLPAEVQFIMLRYPPTKRTPEKHIQRVPVSDESHLKGVEDYLIYLQKKFNEFGPETAEETFAAADKKTAFFCKYICQFKHPKKILKVTNDEGVIMRSLELDDEEGVLWAHNKGFNIERKNYPGCPYFYPKRK